jgi:hypothetical protein
MSQARDLSGERRAATRIYSNIALVYQYISSLDAGLDPYDARFGLPQHFTLSEELARLDAQQHAQLEAVCQEFPKLQAVLEAFDRKLEVLARAIGNSLSQVVSPAPQNVNLSESGLSFHAAEPLLPGSHLHLAISNTTHNYHIAASGRVVFCEEEDLEGYRTGVAFITLRDEDRQVLARDVIRKVRENEVIQDFLNPENG